MARWFGASPQEDKELHELQVLYQQHFKERDEERAAAQWVAEEVQPTPLPPPLSRRRSQMKSLHLTMKAVLQDELPSSTTEELAFQTELLPNYTELTYSREVLLPPWGWVKK